MKFSVQVSSLILSMNSKVQKVVSGTVKALGADVVDRSPVGDPGLWRSEPPKGYVGGNFKANWVHSFNAQSSATSPDIDPTGGVSISRINQSVDAIKDVSGVHFLSNNLPYAIALERGWSSQAPEGMVELTVLDFPRIVADQVKRAAI